MKMFSIVALAGLIVATNTLVSSAQKLIIKGSNTFGEELAPALIKGFSVKNPGVEIDLESNGSASGFAALLDSAADIASSSRPMNEDELRLAQSRQLTIDQHVVGYYGIAVIVNEGNSLQAMSDRQIGKLFTGEITNWKELGGPDEQITIYVPSPKNGTYLGFQELAMAKRPYSERAIEKPGYGEVQQAVATDPFGVGFVSINMAGTGGTRGVIVNGIHPSNTAVVENLYPYARQVRLYTNRDNVSSITKKFIRFVQSRQGQEIVENVGFVPRLATPMDLGGMGP